MDEHLNKYQADAAYRAAFDKLFQDVGFIIRNHLRVEDPSRDPVYRVINMLALHAAVVIAGTNDPQTLELFSAALNKGILQVRGDFLSTQIMEEEEEPPE